MRSSTLFLFLSALVVAPNTLGFSVTSTSTSRSSLTSSSSQLDAVVSRRGAVAQGIFTLATISTTLPAYADVTSKVASQAALRNIKRTVKELQKLEFYAADNKYVELKDGLRVAPITDIRKNCNILIRGGEDGPESEALKAGYADFIKSLEELDSQAGLGIRGRKGINLIDSFDRSVKSLVSFAEVADRATGIPLQVEETEAITSESGSAP